MTSHLGTCSDRAIRARLMARTLRRRLPGHDFEKLPPPEIIRPADLMDCRPALFEAEHLKRVRACGFKSAIHQEVSKLSATCFWEAPTERYRLGPAVIAGGCILTERAMHYIGARSPLTAARAPLAELGEEHLATTQQGLHYFGHWLRDDCTLYEFLREQGHEPLALARLDWPDMRVYEAAFGHGWHTADFARVSDLTVYREPGFNRDKARRIHALRARLRAAHPEDHTGGHIVYLSRGQTGSPRNMSNGESFERAMEAAGIRVVAPGSDPETLLEALLDARMIITIEGSQAAHGVYMLGKGGSMLILQSPDRFYNPHHEWARLIGMGYGTVVGTPDDVSFHIDPVEVLHMADRLDAAAVRSAA